MGRLIDEDVLIQSIKEFTSINDGYFENPQLLERVIKNQPTAYNVEKVVEQTNKIFVDELDRVLKPLPEGAEYTEEAYRVLFLNSETKNIIRNGGKE